MQDPTLSDIVTLVSKRKYCQKSKRKKSLAFCVGVICIAFIVDLAIMMKKISKKTALETLTNYTTDNSYDIISDIIYDIITTYLSE